MRQALIEGRDPLSDKQAAEAERRKIVPTFVECTARFLATIGTHGKMRSTLRSGTRRWPLTRHRLAGCRFRISRRSTLQPCSNPSGRRRRRPRLESVAAWSACSTGQLPKAIGRPPAMRRRWTSSGTFSPAANGRPSNIMRRCPGKTCRTYAETSRAGQRQR